MYKHLDNCKKLILDQSLNTITRQKKYKIIRILDTYSIKINKQFDIICCGFELPRSKPPTPGNSVHKIAITTAWQNKILEILSSICNSLAYTEFNKHLQVLESYRYNVINQFPIKPVFKKKMYIRTV